MKAQPILIGALAIALAGVSVLLVDARTRLSALEQHAPTSTPERGEHDHDELSDRLSRVEAQLAATALSRRSARGEDRESVAAGGPMPTAAKATTSGPMSMEEMRAAIARGESIPMDRMPAGIQEDMARALKTPPEIRDRNQEDQRQAEVSAWVAKLAAEVELSPEKAETLRGVLFTEWLDVRQAFRDRFAGSQVGDRTALPWEHIREIRAKSDENVRAVLSDEQYDAYAELRAQDSLANR